MRSVSIVDYGMGNIYSISNAVQSLGFDTKIIQSPVELMQSDKLILPGVGAYRDAMRVLTEMELGDALRNYVLSGKLILGICLGMQLLLEGSEENGGVSGLGIVKGSAQRFSYVNRYKIPQIQWNMVCWPNEIEMFNGLDQGSMFYFLHSYYCQPKADGLIGAHTRYADVDYCSAFQIGNVWATQFHPEKSGKNGLQLLANFLFQE